MNRRLSVRGQIAVVEKEHQEQSTRCGKLSQFPEDAPSFHHDSFGLISPHFKPRIIAYNIIKSRPYEFFIVTVILLNCILLATENTEGTNRPAYVVISNMILFGIFFLEMLFKSFALGVALHPGSYVRDDWNVVELVCVILQAISVLGDISDTVPVDVIRSLRAFSLIRSVELFVAVAAVFATKFKVIRGLATSVLPVCGVALCLIMCLFSTIAVGTRRDAEADASRSNSGASNNTLIVADGGDSSITTTHKTTAVVNQLLPSVKNNTAGLRFSERFMDRRLSDAILFPFDNATVDVEDGTGSCYLFESSHERNRQSVDTYLAYGTRAGGAHGRSSASSYVPFQQSETLYTGLGTLVTVFQLALRDDWSRAMIATSTTTTSTTKTTVDANGVVYQEEVTTRECVPWPIIGELFIVIIFGLFLPPLVVACIYHYMSEWMSDWTTLEFSPEAQGSKLNELKRRRSAAERKGSVMVVPASMEEGEPEIECSVASRLALQSSTSPTSPLGSPKGSSVKCAFGGNSSGGAGGNNSSKKFSDTAKLSDTGASGISGTGGMKFSLAALQSSQGQLAMAGDGQMINAPDITVENLEDEEYDGRLDDEVEMAAEAADNSKSSRLRQGSGFLGDTGGGSNRKGISFASQPQADDDSDADSEELSMTVVVLGSEGLGAQTQTTITPSVRFNQALAKAAMEQEDVDQRWESLKYVAKSYLAGSSDVDYTKCATVPGFVMLVSFVTFVSICFMASRHRNEPPLLSLISFITEITFIVVAVLELFFRVLAIGAKNMFIRSKRKLMAYVDLIAILVALVAIFTSPRGVGTEGVLNTVFAAILPIRVLKLVKHFPLLQRPVVSLFNGLTTLLFVAVLFFTAVVGGMMFMGHVPDNKGLFVGTFSTFDASGRLVMQLLTGDGWSVIMHYYYSQGLTWSPLYFLLVVGLMQWVLAPFYVAVVLPPIGERAHGARTSTQSSDTTLAPALELEEEAYWNTTMRSINGDGTMSEFEGTTATQVGANTKLKEQKDGAKDGAKKNTTGPPFIVVALSSVPGRMVSLLCVLLSVLILMPTHMMGNTNKNRNPSSAGTNATAIANSENQEDGLLQDVQAATYLSFSMHLWVIASTVSTHFMKKYHVGKNGKRRGLMSMLKRNRVIIAWEGFVLFSFFVYLIVRFAMVGANDKKVHDAGFAAFEPWMLLLYALRPITLFSPCKSLCREVAANLKRYVPLMVVLVGFTIAAQSLFGDINYPCADHTGASFSGPAVPDDDTTSIIVVDPSDLTLEYVMCLLQSRSRYIHQINVTTGVGNNSLTLYGLVENQLGPQEQQHRIPGKGWPPEYRHFDDFPDSFFTLLDISSLDDAFPVIHRVGFASAMSGNASLPYGGAFAFFMTFLLIFYIVCGGLFCDLATTMAALLRNERFDALRESRATFLLEMFVPERRPYVLPRFGVGALRRRCYILHTSYGWWIARQLFTIFAFFVQLDTIPLLYPDTSLPHRITEYCLTFVLCIDIVVGLMAYNGNILTYIWVHPLQHSLYVFTTVLSLFLAIEQLLVHETGLMGSWDPSWYDAATGHSSDIRQIIGYILALRALRMLALIVDIDGARLIFQLIFISASDLCCCAIWYVSVTSAFAIFLVLLVGESGFADFGVALFSLFSITTGEGLLWYDPLERDIVAAGSSPKQLLPDVPNMLWATLIVHIFRLCVIMPTLAASVGVLIHHTGVVMQATSVASLIPQWGSFSRQWSIEVGSSLVATVAQVRTVLAKTDLPVGTPRFLRNLAIMRPEDNSLTPKVTGYANKVSNLWCVHGRRSVRFIDVLFEMTLSAVQASVLLPNPTPLESVHLEAIDFDEVVRVGCRHRKFNPHQQAVSMFDSITKNGGGSSGPDANGRASTAEEQRCLTQTAGGSPESPPVPPRRARRGSWQPKEGEDPEGSFAVGNPFQPAFLGSTTGSSAAVPRQSSFSGKGAPGLNAARPPATVREEIASVIIQSLARKYISNTNKPYNGPWGANGGQIADFYGSSTFGGRETVVIDSSDKNHMMLEDVDFDNDN